MFNDSPGGGAKLLRATPKYLFRGEPGFYSSTTSSAERIESELSQSETRDLHRVLTDIADCLSRSVFQPLPPIGSPEHQVVLWRTGAWLQHYGIPTRYVDFTSDLSVAAFFAANSNSGVGGRIYVVETELMKRVSPIHRMHQSGARRPIVQNAYGIRLWDGENLQDEATYPIMKYEFEYTSIDSFFGNRPELMSINGDSLASFILAILCQQKPQCPKIVNIIDRVRRGLIESYSLDS